MLFSYGFSFAILLASAAANLHDSCTCHNGDSYNERMTTLACTAYNNAKYQWGGVAFNSATGRCDKSGTDSRIAGDQWEDACKSTAKAGFPCANGQGTCFAEPDNIKGWCK